LFKKSKYYLSNFAVMLNRTTQAPIMDKKWR
jgi:hypothetical protein